jgi:predicted nucleic acid-binding protein
VTDDAALLDTSVFIARESGRPLAAELLPTHLAVSVITLAELQAGVLIATDTAIRSRRLATLRLVSGIAPLPVDETVAEHWATLRVQLAEAGRRAGANDLWIAATAIANNLPVATQDDDFDVLATTCGLSVLKV